MHSIQFLITEHVSILLQEYYQYHFRGFPLHELSLEVKAERVPELADAAEVVAPELVPAIISALHRMNGNLNGHTRPASKKQKYVNLA